MPTNGVIIPLDKALLAISILEQNHSLVCYKPISKSQLKSIEYTHYGAYKDHPRGLFLGFITISSSTREVVAIYAVHQNLADCLAHHVHSISSSSLALSVPYRPFSLDAPDLISCRRSIVSASSSYASLKEIPSITFTANMSYKAHLSRPDRERCPSLHVFASTNIYHKDPIIIYDPENQTSLNLKFELSAVAITDHTEICFEQYSEYMNEEGKWCLTPAGCGTLHFVSLLRCRDGKPLKLNLAYTNSMTKTVKARIVLSDINVKVSSSVQLVISNTVEESLLVKRTAFKNACDVSEAYITDNMHFYNSRPVTSKAIRNVTVFLDRRRKGFFPGSLFDVFRAPRTKAEFYFKMLEISIQRKTRIQTKVDLLGRDFCKNPDSQYKLYCVMNMLNMFNHYCKYITDLFDHDGRVEMTDSFDPIEHRGCADCEDFAAFILRLIIDLMIHFSNTTSLIMREILIVLSRYTFGSVLCGVSSMAISDNSPEKSQLRSHEAVFAIPTEDILTAIGNYNPKDPIFSLIQSQEYSYKKLPCDHIIPLEGTGILLVEPNGMHAEEKDMIADLKESIPVLKSCSKNIYTYDPNSKNNFFKIMSTFINPLWYMMFGKPEIEWIFAYKPAKSGDLPSRGVWFKDLMNINSHPEVMLVPCPSITPEVFAAYSIIKSSDYPRVKLNGLTLQPHHVKIQRILSSATSVPPSEILSSAISRFYFPFENLTEESANSLRSSLQSKGYSFITRVEPVATLPYKNTPLGGYELLVFKY